MNIAINTRFLLSSKMEGFGWYTYEISKRLVEMHPEHTFYFFFDRPFDSRFIFAKNVVPVVLSPPARHPILFYIWFEWSVKRALKKYNIDLFFSPDGYLSLGSSVKQIGTIHDINFEHYPNDLPKNALNYLKKYFPKFASKADKILTVSNYSKQDIVNTYGIESDKIHVVHNGASDEFKPIDTQAKIDVQTKYSNGKPYFLFVGSLHPRKNLKRLIQAYQEFYKFNQSIDLVIVGAVMWNSLAEEITIDDNLKNVIHFTGHLATEELAKVIASAYIFTYVPYFEGFGIPLVEAMKSGVPVLSGNVTSLPEVGGDAVYYCDPFDVESIKKGMVELHDNNNLRQNLIEKGLIRSKQFNWDNAAKAIAGILGL